MLPGAQLFQTKTDGWSNLTINYIQVLCVGFLVRFMISLRPVREAIVEACLTFVSKWSTTASVRVIWCMRDCMFNLFVVLHHSNI